MDENGQWPYFFDRLVHDLREPLRSVYSFSELIRELAAGRLGNEGEQAVQEILGAATNMRVLIEGVSRFAWTLDPARSAAEASLQLAFNMASLKFDRELVEAGGTLSGEQLPRAGASLEQLNFLFENVIGNALRFRAESAPEIRVTAVPERESGYWLIRVEDNGIGIPEADMETVFRPFARLHGRKFPGAGLGLTGCRNIVESHGGRIWMESRPDGGCVCCFTLPVA
jgi:signal transduction histidine kinase